jgi:hypothetical protein
MIKMKTLSLKISLLAFISYFILTSNGFAQQGTVTINQDKNIDVLLDLKKEMNKTDNSTDRYKIQVYSGNRSDAEATQTKFNATFDKWISTLKFEYPNYKIWVGNFTTRLERSETKIFKCFYFQT